MKIKLFLFTFLIGSLLYAQENYKIEIDGKTINVELEKDYTVSINKKLVSFKISVKDSLIYNDNMLQFKYPKDYKITSTVVDEGIEQLILMTAEGSGFLIQKYTTMNPTMLNEMMINEVTKESVNYGFELKREDYEKTLKSGLKLNVSRAVLTYKNDINIYEIVSVGKKDEGLLFMTMEMDNIENSSGKKLIKMIWDTLKIY